MLNDKLASQEKMITSERNQYLDDISNQKKEELHNRIIYLKYHDRLKKERFAIFLILLSNLFFSMKTIILKYTEKTYTEKFHIISCMIFLSVGMILTSIIMRLIGKERFYKPSQIHAKVIFVIGTCMYFFIEFFHVLAVYYLRVTTVQIITNLNPLIVQVLSIIILKEKCKIRYLVGFIVCFFGSLFIVKSEVDNSALFEENLIRGFSTSVVKLLLISVSQLAEKIIEQKHIPLMSHLFYLGINIIILCFLYLLIFQELSLREVFVDEPYIILNITQGILFYFGNILLNIGLMNIDLSGSSIISFSKLVFLIIFGKIFLGLKIKITDFLGMIFIIGYLIYDIKHPFNKEKAKLKIKMQYFS